MGRVLADNAVDHGAELAFDAVPVVSIGVTVLIEGQRVLTDNPPRERRSGVVVGE